MNTIWQRVGKVSQTTIYILLVYTIIYGGCSFFLDNWSIVMMDEMLLIAVFADTHPLGEIQKYQTFGYCRKKLFSFCMVGEGIRALIYGGIFRTVMQVLFYPEYVKYYMQDAKETAGQYHQCPIWELFLVNIIIFLFMRLILVLDSTRKYPILHIQNAFKKEKKADMPFWRKMFRVIEFMICFIIWLIIALIALGSYDFILKNPIGEKIGIYLASIVGVFILLLILRWRFRPKDNV